MADRADPPYELDDIGESRTAAAPPAPFAIEFPFSREDVCLRLGDVAFGKHCVEVAARAGDHARLADAVEALCRAVIAETVAFPRGAA